MAKTCPSCSRALSTRLVVAGALAETFACPNCKKGLCIEVNWTSLLIYLVAGSFLLTIAVFFLTGAPDYIQLLGVAAIGSFIFFYTMSCVLEIRAK